MRPAPRRPAVALLGALALLCSLPALGSDPADAFVRCRALEDDAARLACYDAAATAFVSAEAPVPDEAEAGKRAEGTQPEARPTRIVSIAERPRGERIFELEDGSRWTEQTRERTRFSKGERVTVQRTVLGGSLLVREAGGATRVRPLD